MSRSKVNRKERSCPFLFVFCCCFTLQNKWIAENLVPLCQCHIWSLKEAKEVGAGDSLFFVFTKIISLLLFYYLVFSWKLFLFFRVQGFSGMFRNVWECSVFLVLSTDNYDNTTPVWLASRDDFYCSVIHTWSTDKSKAVIGGVTLVWTPSRKSELNSNWLTTGKECGSILSSHLWGGALRDDTKNGCVADYRGRGWIQDY